MLRLGSLLLLVGSIGLFPVTASAHHHDAKNEDLVIAVDRNPGFVSADSVKTMDLYRFTIARNGDWEFKPSKGEAKKGKLAADDLTKWVQDVEEAGLYGVPSNPELGARDEPFLEITVDTWGRKAKIRMRPAEKVAKAIEKKIVELLKPDEK